MNTISYKIDTLREKISETALKLGRNVDDITLVAVTKHTNVIDIREAYNAGQRDFGENYVQSVLPKMEQLPDDIRWHFIGRLQKNKINKILGRFVLIHSIDSMKIADALNSRAKIKSITQDILIEVKTSDESSKQGIPLSNCIEFVRHIIDNFENLNLKGLMTVAPFTHQQKPIEKSFRALRILRDDLSLQGIKLPELSMGMTQDWQIAIEYGATILRVGTAIFGS
jgi:pyridoxal phosphate enzyme (YggS family)